MPAGFAKKTVGYVRVAGNCAMCHAYSRSNGPDARPRYSPRAPVTQRKSRASRVLQTVRARSAFQRRQYSGRSFDGDEALFRGSLALSLHPDPKDPKRFLRRDGHTDHALWRHTQDPPAAPGFRQKMRDLEADLKGPEKDELGKYLNSFR